MFSDSCSWSSSSAALGYGGYWFYQSRQARNRGREQCDERHFHADGRGAAQGNLNSTITVVGQLAAVQSADLAFDGDERHSASC